MARALTARREETAPPAAGDQRQSAHRHGLATTVTLS
jgi:hypothetical protein